MSENKGKVIHINDFGLCQIATNEHLLVAFTLDKLSGYAGQPLRDVGLKVGAEVVFQSDGDGRVTSAGIASATAGF